MINNYLGLFSYALVTALIIVEINKYCFIKKHNIARNSFSWRLSGIAFAVFVASLLVKVDGISWSKSLLGLLSNLSISSMLLIIWALYNSLMPQRRFELRNKKLLAGIAVVFGFLLYPAELGFMTEGIYYYGYYSKIIIAAFMLLAVAMWRVSRFPVLTVIAAVLAYFCFPVFSKNFFDYIIDFPLVFFAIIWLIRNAK